MSLEPFTPEQHQHVGHVALQLVRHRTHSNNIQMNQAPSESGAREARVLAAYKIMKSVYDRCQQAGNTTEETHLAIRSAYPWGKRRAWPYKAWLQARREFYERHGLPLRARRSIAETLEANS